jgi:hypothetical protein
VSFTTVITYEVIKIWKALGTRALEAFFGIRSKLTIVRVEVYVNKLFSFSKNLLGDGLIFLQCRGRGARSRRYNGRFNFCPLDSCSLPVPVTNI